MFVVAPLLGEWWALGYGLTLLVVSTFGVSFALLPSILLAAPGLYFLSRGPRVLAYPFAFLSNVYTAAVVTGWCVWVLQRYLQHADRPSLLPLLLWSYGTATGPWTWLASKDRDSPASMTTATAAQLGYIVMMLMAIVFSPTLLDVAIAFGIVLGPGAHRAVRGRRPHAAQPASAGVSPVGSRGRTQEVSPPAPGPPDDAMATLNEAHAVETFKSLVPLAPGGLKLLACSTAGRPLRCSRAGVHALGDA